MPRSTQSQRIGLWLGGGLLAWWLGEPRNPLFVADQPWENSLNNLYPNVAFDPERRCFRLWYKCVLADKEAIAKMMPPATVHDVGWFLLYAQSPDGVTWTEPDLGLIGFEGSLHTNIVARDTPNVGVCYDPHDADGGRVIGARTS